MFSRLRSTSIAVLVLASSASLSQGQASTVDSLDASTVRDSARVGSLIYRAATTLTYPKRDPGKPSDIEGDLTTTLTIANTGTKRAEIKLTRCPVRTYAFLGPDYRPFPRIRGFHNTLSCLTSDQTVALGAGETKELTVASRNWKHGDAAWLGPMYFAAELQLPDTAIRLSAGKSAMTSSLDAVDYHAVSSLKGVAPANVVTTVTISNRGESTVQLQYGACALDLLAFTSPDKTGKPAWVSNPDGMCILPLYTSMVAPGHSMTRTVAVPTHDMRKDPIPAGRYFFTAELTLNKTKMVMDAGALTLRGAEDPLPKSRQLKGIEFSGAARRLRSRTGAPDSLEVKFTIHNTDKKTHRLLTDPLGNPGCAYIAGYQDRAMRDAHYSRPAYEAQWIARPCPLRVPEIELEPGESRTFTNRILSPPGSLFYVLGLEFSVDTWGAQSLDVDFAVDEEGGPSRKQ